MKTKFLILMLSVISLTAFAQQKKVAVYVTGEQSGVSKVLGDQLVAAFAKSGKYTAVERTSSFLAELSKEQSYQRSGAVNDREIARLGSQFGVNYVCVADMSDVFGEKYISARLINVETAEIVNTHNVSGELNNMSSLLKMAGEIADNLSKGSFAEQAIEIQKREEAARLIAEEAAKARAHQQEIEHKKYELRSILNDKYCIVERDHQKWMVYIEPLKNVTKSMFNENNYYSRCGYKDWQIGAYDDFYKPLQIIASELNHYLGKSIPIYESGHYFIVEDSGSNEDCSHCSIMYCGRTKLSVKTNGYTYLDGQGDLYTMDIGNFEYLEKKDDMADAILVRRVR